MIITRTPLRISLAGGGTDIKSYYRFEPGKVINVLEENIFIIKCGSGAIKIYNIEPDIKLIQGDYI